MKTADAISEILKREGVEWVIGYPVNHVLEHAAHIGIRPIIVRQERTGLHMADAISRVTSGRKIGTFCMQHGPGTENAYGGVAQAYSELVPVLVMPMGYARRQAWVHPSYNAPLQMQGITKSAEPLTSAREIPNVFRRAFSRLRSGRGGPVLVEIPVDVWNEEIEALDYTPARPLRSGPDPEAIREAAAMLVKARRPVIYAGQGVHWAEAWDELRELAELLAIPVCTSLEGKSAFPETHPLSLGSGGLALPQTVRHFLDEADLILGIGCSFTETNFGVQMPKGKTVIHATLDPMDIGKDLPCTLGVLGDARLVLAALIDEARKLAGPSPRDPAGVEREIREVHTPWLERWLPKLEAEGAPLNPYRVLWDLQRDGRRRQHHHHPRCRQPARPALAVLAEHDPALLSRLGQEHAAWLRPGPRHGGEARQAREALHQCLGRCRDRLHRHGLRDRGARADPDPLHPAQQFLHGDRAQGDAGLDRALSFDRHFR